MPGSAGTPSMVYVLPAPVCSIESTVVSAVGCCCTTGLLHCAEDGCAANGLLRLAELKVLESQCINQHLAIGKDADVVAIEGRDDQLADVCKHLLLPRVGPKHPVKFEGLRSRPSSLILCESQSSPSMSDPDCVKLAMSMLQRQGLALSADGAS